MSKDNPNLRLSGSPVNLSYRGRKKEDKNNIRNRPRSALQNSCFTPDCHERFRRPFSADTKERAPSTRSFLKTLSAELLQTYSLTPKVGPPSADLLAKSKSVEGRCYYLDKDICSNASDYGSEDTFISLGTKIKAKAQSGSKQKQLKYKNAGKRGRKNMEHLDNDKTGNDYGLQIKITERPQRVSSPNKLEGANGENSILKNRNYESYFIPLESGKKFDENSLAGRVSFGSNVNNEVEQAIDKYSRRLSLTKQQLSLVEEESTQDLESMQSHSNNMSSLSPENSLEDPKNVNAAVPVKDRAKREDEFSKTFKNCDPKTYNSFYDDFRIEEIDDYKRAMSSTVIHADASSKDSGYPDSGNNEEKSYKQNICVPKSPFIKKSKSQSKVGQPKSFDGISRLDTRGTWSEPLNHSRLLYKDFFLKKEGHISIAPQNSLTNISDPNIPGTSEVKNDPKIENIDENLTYPPYLLNSSTKAYTSKVIEDYKKELEAINNLHELTLKDIKIDAISPTPLNIDKMFEDHLKPEDIVTSDNSQDTPEKKAIPKKNTLDTSTKDVSKISTKELIQNYWKVKGSDYKDFTPKTAKRFEKKCSNLSSKIDEIIGVGGLKHEWNNRTSSSNIPKTVIPVNIRNQTQKNMFTMKAPLSARIESVQNDRDVDSWMSLTAPSPRLIEAENESLVENSKPDENPSPSGVSEEININPNDNMKTDKDIPKPKDLSSNSTVLDIYSMLKEIESYGDNPVTSVATHDTLEKGSNDVIKEVSSQSPPPKDNFLEIFEFLEKVEQSANDALSVVTTTVPQTTPKLESLLKLPQTELAQRLVTASLQLEERSCCIALLQESLANHKEQMVQKVSNLEKQSLRQIGKVKQECEQTIKRHQNFIDQLINDKKTLNHRIEQLVDERRSLEERWKRSAASLEERYKLELRNQHDKMAAAQQVARQRWVRQKAEKIKELTVKGLEGELREMAERQQKEISDLKMYHAEQTGRIQAKHSQEIEELRRSLEAEKEAALVKERQMASSRLEKQILELELTYQEQRTRLVAEMRAENERAAQGLSEKEREHKLEIDKWKEEQERLLEERRQKMENEMAEKRSKMEEEIKLNRLELEKKFEQFKQDYDAEQQVLLRKKVTEISAQHKQERDRDIEKAIESLEAEAHSGRKELQEALRRNKEQYETELRELAATEQATLRRYQDAQARIRLTEDRCAELEITITQLETRNRVLIEKNNQLDTRAEEIKKSCEESWQKKVETLQKEMEDMKKTHDEQMHQLYAKVKVAVARKDSAIQALTRENGKYQEKVTVLEQKLQQQRKDFLKQK